MKNISFSDIAMVSCGTLSLELNHLKNEPVKLNHGEESFVVIRGRKE